MPGNKLSSTYFSQDILDFLSCLNRHSVDFLLIGGEAVIFYGYPRVTGDIDIFYRISPVNIEHLYEALSDFWGGLVPGISSSSELGQEGVIIQFGVPPNRVDLVNRIDGVDFNEAAANAVDVILAETEPSVKFRIIGLDALISNKKAAGRPKDLDDVRFLEAARRKKDN